MMSKETNKLTEDSIYSANENGTVTSKVAAGRRNKNGSKQQEESVDELYDPSAAVTPSGGYSKTALATQLNQKMHGGGGTHRDKPAYINVTAEDEEELRKREKQASLLSRTFHEQMELQRQSQKVKTSDGILRGSRRHSKGALSLKR